MDDSQQLRAIAHNTRWIALLLAGLLIGLLFHS
jgi:ABC-type transport system involved in cytochrome c biogenesis permease component